jgi:serine/threonine protein phosphatase PrpC
MLCPRCGAAAEPDSRFCEACGAALAEIAAGYGASAAADHREIDLGPDLAAVTDRGLIHRQNEDAVALSRGIAGGGDPVSIIVVCDGVSSSYDPARGASAAAAAAADSLVAALAARAEPEAAMRQAVIVAHDAVCNLVPTGADPVARPLTTIVAALVRPGAVTVSWAGDSRAYVLAGDGRLLTRDDSWVNMVVERGEMSEAEAMCSPNAHAIVQCLGDPDDVPDPHTVTVVPAPGETLLLCTDGLWNYALQPARLAALLSRFPEGTPAVKLCRALVEFANDAGGHDNVTAAICNSLQSRGGTSGATSDRVGPPTPRS